MQGPSSFTVIASGKSAPYPLDRYVNGYAIAVTMKTAGAIYSLQQCFDNPFLDDDTGLPYTTSYNVSGTWLPFSDPIMVNASTNAVSNLAFIPRAIRINVTAKVSAGNPVKVTLIPLGMDAN